MFGAGGGVEISDEHLHQIQIHSGVRSNLHNTVIYRPQQMIRMNCSVCLLAKNCTWIKNLRIYFVAFSKIVSTIRIVLFLLSSTFLLCAVYRTRALELGQTLAKFTWMLICDIFFLILIELLGAKITTSFRSSLFQIISRRFFRFVDSGKFRCRHDRNKERARKNTHIHSPKWKQLAFK